MPSPGPRVYRRPVGVSRKAGVAGLSVAGLVLLSGLVLSVLGDLGTKPDRACERSGGDICLLLSFDASDRTVALVVAVVLWVGVAAWLARGRVMRLLPGETMIPSERIVVAGAASLTAVVLVAAVALTRG